MFFWGGGGRKKEREHVIREQSDREVRKDFSQKLTLNPSPRVKCAKPVPGGLETACQIFGFPI